MKINRKLVTGFALALMMSIGMMSPATAAETGTVNFTVTVQAVMSITVNDAAVTDLASVTVGACNPIGGAATWSVTSNAVYDVDASAVATGGSLATSTLLRHSAPISAAPGCATGTGFPRTIVTSGAITDSTGTAPANEHYAVEVPASAAPGTTAFMVTYTVSAS